MAIEDYIPNIFGGAPSGYEGLLGADQSAALQKRANLAGLLGSVAALAQGMGGGGYPRSPFQNITNALVAGYSGAGQTYQSGLQNLMQQQQFGLQQRQMAGVQAMKMKYPDLADEFDTNPAGAFRIVAEREQAIRKPVTLGEGQSLVSPQGELIYASPQSRKKNTAVVGNRVIDLDTGLPIFEAPAETKPVVVDGNLVNPATGEVIFASPKQKDRKTAVVNGVLVDTETGQPIYGTPTSVASIEEYKFYLSQGGKKTYEQFLKEKIPGAPAVNVYTGDLSKTTVGEVEKGVLSSAEAMSRLNSIYGTYRPEYLNVPFRAKQEWTNLAGKFKDIDPKDKQILTGYYGFKQNALQNLNKTIKDLTGAAMGVQEADRIIASLPNAGSTVFGGDSPIEFEAKLNNAVQQTKYALARQTYALKSGIKKDAWEKIPLSDMPSIVNKRAEEIAKAYKLDPNKEADKQTIKRQLAAEFGIPF